MTASPPPLQINDIDHINDDIHNIFIDINVICFNDLSLLANKHLASIGAARKEWG